MIKIFIDFKLSYENSSAVLLSKYLQTLNNRSVLNRLLPSINLSRKKIVNKQILFVTKFLLKKNTSIAPTLYILTFTDPPPNHS